MKKFLIIYVVFSISLFAQFGNPKIVPLEKEFDFGEIKEGETVSHDFIILNQGGDILEITKVKASCGCTAANPSKKQLAPGDSTSISVKFNSTRRSGKQKKYVYIFSNDPETPQLRLLFTANVIAKDKNSALAQPVVKLSKYTHNFGNIKGGEVYDFSVSVINAGKANLTIKKIKSSCGCTAALMSEKLIAPQKKAELNIKFDTKNLSGQVARTVTLFTNDPVNPTRVITLIANIEKG